MSTECLDLLERISIREVILIAMIGIALFKTGSKVVELIEKWHDKKNHIQKIETQIQDNTSITLVMKAGLLELLRYRLFRECEKQLEKGYATTDDLKDIDGMYKAYKELGGNGTGDTLYGRVKNLKLKSDD